jgi:hypothetical protein
VSFDCHVADFLCQYEMFESVYQTQANQPMSLILYEYEYAIKRAKEMKKTT